MGEVTKRLTSEQLEKFHQDLDLNSPEFNDHFEEIMDDLLARCPVAHGVMANNRLNRDQDGWSDDFWMVTRAQDVNAVAQRTELFSSRLGGITVRRPPGMLVQGVDETDPPLHNHVRKALNPSFSPAAAAAFDADIRTMADLVIDTFADDGECRLIEQFTAVFPGRFFFKHIMGVDSPDDLSRMSDAAERMLAGDHTGVDEFNAFNENLLRSRADTEPRGDVIDVILALEIDGEPASWEYKNSVLANVAVGGLETTSKMLARSLHFLALNPEVRRHLCENPSDIELAVEECLRLFTSAWYLGRTATEDTEVAGTAIPKNGFVMLAWAAANRDPEVYDRPEEFDMHRPVQRHLTFGSGRHRCLGSHLARRMLIIGLEAFLARIPEFEIAPGANITIDTAYIARSISEVPIVFPTA